jgi:hypothetical protein
MGLRMSASCDMLQATVNFSQLELSQFAWYRSLTVNRRVLKFAACGPRVQ